MRADKKVTSFNLSSAALEKLDRIAYSIDKSRSDTMDRLILNLSDYTLTRYGKRPVKGGSSDNEEADS